ncbi:MAG: hypothetical protein WBM90_11635 [Acidimicrobiia bacterium]
MYLPDITGVIHIGTEMIMYRMQGISLLPDEHDRRLFAGPVRWYTESPRLVWLNDRWGYEEGQLERDTLQFTTRAHVIHPEGTG